MRLLFNSPDTAAIPVVYFVTSPNPQQNSGDYLHMRAFKSPDDRALDAEAQQAIMERSAVLFEKWLP